MLKKCRELADNRIVSRVMTAACFIVIMLVTVFPYFRAGLYGYAPDYLYHLNRIEGVKDAIAAGRYPAAVYPHFFYGQGYGSALFYPDIFLVIPALLGLLGMEALPALKLYMAAVCLIASAVTYGSLRVIVRDRIIALSGTFLLMLSQFYLADLVVRSGFSGYMCYIFLPLWAAGLYDYFVLEGKRTWMIGAGLTGMVLCHTINTFLSLFLTVMVFVCALFFRKGRKAFFDIRRIRRLLVTAACSVLLSAFYTFPMLEQMTSGVEFMYSRPWAHVSEFVQPFENYFLPTGYFFNIAFVGIGIPVLIMAAVRVFAGSRATKGGRAFYYAGLLLLLSMTSVLPWKLLEKTIFNQLQFTFRLYPFALVFLIFGICILLRDMTAADGNGARVRWNALIACAVLSIVFGIWQNMTVLKNEFWVIDRQTIREYSDMAGRGEWLPAGYNPELGKALSELPPFAYLEEAPETVMPYERDAAAPGGVFEKPATDSIAAVIVPQIYYKGYSAVLDSAGEKLPVSISDNGFTRIETPGTPGTVRVAYTGTFCQKISRILSLLTAAGLIFLYCQRIRRRRAAADKGAAAHS